MKYEVWSIKQNIKRICHTEPVEVQEIGKGLRRAQNGTKE